MAFLLGMYVCVCSLVWFVGCKLFLLFACLFVSLFLCLLVCLPFFAWKIQVRVFAKSDSAYHFLFGGCAVDCGSALESFVETLSWERSLSKPGFKNLFFFAGGIWRDCGEYSLQFIIVLLPRDVFALLVEGIACKKTGNLKEIAIWIWNLSFLPLGQL